VLDRPGVRFLELVFRVLAWWAPATGRTGEAGPRSLDGSRLVKRRVAAQGRVLAPHASPTVATGVRPVGGFGPAYRLPILVRLRR